MKDTVNLCVYVIGSLHVGKIGTYHMLIVILKMKYEVTNKNFSFYIQFLYALADLI